MRCAFHIGELSFRSLGGSVTTQIYGNFQAPGVRQKRVVGGVCQQYQEPSKTWGYTSKTRRRELELGE